MTVFRLEAPVVGFRPYASRDYQETLPLPPHSTVFGCLLSIIGVDRGGLGAYVGTRLGVAGRSGERSTVLRKMRRDPANVKKGQVRVPAFRPEYQELLVDLVVWAWVEQGDAEKDLAADILAARERPRDVTRHGVVSLGESCFMLDAFTRCEEPPDDVTVLRPREDGSLSLTVWVDFADRNRTRSARFEPVAGCLSAADTVPIRP